MILKTPTYGLWTLTAVTAGLRPAAGRLKHAEMRKAFRGEASGRIIAPLVEGDKQVGVVLECDGTATHLGSYRRTEEIRFGEHGRLMGNFVLRSADGDELHIRFEAGMVSTSEARGTYEITGGRGRYQGVSGEALVVVTIDGSYIGVVFDGSVCY